MTLDRIIHVHWDCQRPQGALNEVCVDEYNLLLLPAIVTIYTFFHSYQSKRHAVQIYNVAELLRSQKKILVRLSFSFNLLSFGCPSGTSYWVPWKLKGWEKRRARFIAVVELARLKVRQASPRSHNTEQTIIDDIQQWPWTVVSVGVTWWSVTCVIIFEIYRRRKEHPFELSDINYMLNFVGNAGTSFYFYFSLTKEKYLNLTTCVIHVFGNVDMSQVRFPITKVPENSLSVGRFKVTSLGWCSLYCQKVWSFFLSSMCNRS